MTSKAFPSDWSSVSLSDLMEEVDLRVSDLPSEQQQLEVLSLTKRWGLVPQTERFDKRIATDDVTGYKVVRPGWIVYNPYVIWEGAIHALRRAAPGIVSPVYVVWKLKANDGGFLDLTLRSPRLVQEYQRLAAGAVNRRRSIKKSDFLAIRVSCPPLQERRQIAKMLLTVQQAIEQRERLLAILAEFKKALMQRLFTQGVIAQPTRQTEIGLVPVAWTESRLGSVARLSSGGTPSRNVSEYWAGGTIPWVKTGEVNYGTIASTEERITKEGLDNSSAKMLPVGTLLMAMYGQGVTRGRVAILGISAATNQACAAITPRSEDEVSTNFLYHFLEFHYGRLRQRGHGANQPNLSMTLLKQFPVYYPQRPEQNAIVDMLRAVDDKRGVHERERATLMGLSQALADQLMSAQIRVHDLDFSALEDFEQEPAGAV